MVLENALLPFSQWLPLGLAQWLLIAAALGVIALGGGFTVAAFRYGPRAASAMTWRLLGAAAADLVHVSPRRVWALARLAIQESVRRRVVVVFVLFVLMLLFAGWFLDPGTPDPARLYISVVLTMTSYLVLLLVLFLSVFSLPADLASRTLHTVVTKPVRPSEIVLGRMLGFTILGSVLLAAMGTISYGFVVRGLSHTHEVIVDSLRPYSETYWNGSESGSKSGSGIRSKALADQPGADKQGKALSGRSTTVNDHAHKVYLSPSDEGRLDSERAHWHAVWTTQSGGKTVYEVGPPQGQLLARAPVYGKLVFRERSGRVTQGINVGDEWTYRKYIEGGTLAAAVWTFDGIREKDFPDGLPVELTVGVFRSEKGNIEKGIPGSLSVRNPKTGLELEARIFTAKEFAIDRQFIPRKLQTPDGKEIDLFKDLVSEGHVELLLRCLQPRMYFGAGQADVYVRAYDASFAANFAKGYFGIELQMVLVIGFGVMFSTFLSGPVAMIATLGTLVGGLFSPFVWKLATGQTFGGGPVESFIRLITQQNAVTPMEPGLRTTAAKMIDMVLDAGLLAVTSTVPSFGDYGCSNYVASGFDVPINWMLQRGLSTLGFIVLLYLAGYFCFKTREVAR